MSRSTAFEFKPLDRTSLEKILTQGVQKAEKIVSPHKIELSKEAVNHLIQSSGGDARRLLNALELAVKTTQPSKAHKIVIDLKTAEASTQTKSIRYDKKGDDHYDTISAFIKSMRGGDPDAALYWMAKMLHAGEDPRFIARRVMICASEDVGNADPQAISVATAAGRMVEMVGMPEARIPLAQAVTYVACAPKSNASYLAIDAALREVESGPAREVPTHLKDASQDKKSLGHGVGYLYPHDFPGHFVPQEYMPQKKEFYQPTDEGYDTVIKERLAKWKKTKPQK
jgi:putative ATPase